MMYAIAAHARLTVHYLIWQKTKGIMALTAVWGNECHMKRLNSRRTVELVAVRTYTDSEERYWRATELGVKLFSSDLQN